jgi:hypothetical protein
VEERTCDHCGLPIPPRISAEMRSQAARVNLILPAPGRAPRFCSSAHRERARLRRERGLPEDAYLEGGRRGHVRLGELTRREQADAWEKRARAIELLRETADYLAKGPSVYESRGLRTVGE